MAALALARIEDEVDARLERGLRNAVQVELAIAYGALREAREANAEEYDRGYGSGWMQGRRGGPDTRSTPAPQAEAG